MLLLPFYLFQGMYPFHLHIVIQSKVEPISRVQTKKISHVHEEMFNYEVYEMPRMSLYNQGLRVAKSCTSNLSQLAAMWCHLVVIVQTGLNIDNSGTEGWPKLPGHSQQFQEFPSQCCRFGLKGLLLLSRPLQRLPAIAPHTSPRTPQWPRKDKNLSPQQFESRGWIHYRSQYIKFMLS